MDGKIKFDKLNDQNYSSWAYRCKLQLEEKEVWFAIETNAPQANERNQAQVTAWNKANSTAKFIIASTIENNQLHLVKRTVTAAEAWNNIRAHHRVPTLGGQVRLLTQLFNERIEHNGDMVKHINQMMTILDELAEMDAPVEPKYAIGAIIASVNKYYSSLITGIEAWNDDRLTLQALNAKLIEEWRKRQSSESSRRSSEASRQSSETTRRSSEQSRQKSEASHYKSEQPRNVSEASSNKHTGPGSSTERNNNRENKEDSISDWYVNSVSLTHANTTQVDNNIWIIDSGASAHMCAWKESFTTLYNSHHGSVTVADGKQIPVLGTGNISLTVSTGKSSIRVNMTNVLYVPMLNTNLISVHQLGKKGHHVTFTKDNCLITIDNMTNHIGRSFNGMYKLNHFKTHGATVKKQPEENNEASHCIHEWHRKLAHRNLDDIKRQLKEEKIKIDKCNHTNDCEACIKGKMSRKPFSTAQPIEAPLDVIVSDVCGPLPTESVDRKRYFVTFTDAYSKYTDTFFMREKSEVTQIAIDYLERIHTLFGKWPKTFRSDRGKEYINEKFQRYLQRRGIKSEFTVGYAPEQNGIAERKNRTLMEATRSMLASSRLPKMFWTEAIKTATFVFNRIINKATKKTPFELLHGSRHKYVKFHEFGSNCYIMIPDEKRRKLDNKAIKARFLGYDEHSKGYRVLVGNRKITVSREVNFVKSKTQNEDTHTQDDSDDEDYFDFTEINKNHSPSEETLSNEENHSPSEETPSNEEATTDETIPENENNRTIDSIQDSDYQDAEESLSHNEESSEDEEQDSTLTRSGGEEPRWNFTRSNRGIPPAKYDPCNTVTNNNRDPRNYKEAIFSKDGEHWLQAMENELDAIERNNTWQVTNLPPGRKAIGSKWVFKSKRDENGNINERKARLVAQGFSQKFGIDYDEVFAPVARGTTLRILLSVAGNRNLTVEHWDVKSAFLNGELKEEIYMKQPPGFELENKVVRLKKSLYGLKQAAHVWNQALHTVLVESGFKQSPADQCLYTKHKEGKVVYLLVHVDDIITASNSQKALEATKQQLMKHFELKNLGGVRQYLGITIERIDNKFYISQASYIQTIIEEAQLTNAKSSKFPLDTGYFKANETATQDQLSLLESNSEFRKLIGMLLYLSVNTRPDIAASIAILSKRVEKPRIIDMCELKRVIRYLKGTQHLKLLLNEPENKDGKLIAFSDANWAEDTTDRKSTSGHYCSLNGGTISWFSRKQDIVALSSCEAEYIALAETCKEVTWIREVLKCFDITTTEPTRVYTDSQSCIAMVENKRNSNRTKHIDIKYHYVKQEVERNKVRLKYIPTDHNVADLMTKPLGGVKTEALRTYAGLELIMRNKVDHHYPN